MSCKIIEAIFDTVSTAIIAAAITVSPAFAAAVIRTSDKA
jgi:hypothetical protein